MYRIPNIQLSQSIIPNSLLLYTWPVNNQLSQPIIPDSLLFPYTWHVNNMITRIIGLCLCDRQILVSPHNVHEPLFLYCHRNYEGFSWITVYKYIRLKQTTFILFYFVGETCNGGDLYHVEKENTKIVEDESSQAMENPRDDFVTKKI